MNLKKGEHTKDPETDGEPERDPEPEDKDAKFHQIRGELGFKPDQKRVENVTENWRKINEQIKNNWQSLRNLILQALKEQGRMSKLEEVQMLDEELILVENLELLMEQRMVSLRIQSMKIEFGTDY